MRLPSRNSRATQSQRPFPWWAKAAATLTLISQLGASCCDELCERVASVEIVPPVTHAEMGAEFEISAIARDADGIPLSVMPDAEWSGSVEFVSDDANPTIVTAPSENVRDIRVKIGKVESDAAVVIVKAEDTALDVVDKLQTHHTPLEPVSAVLLDAMFFGATDCDLGNDLFYLVAAGAVLERNLIDPCQSGQNKLAIFSPDRGAWFEKGPALDKLWDLMENSVTRLELPPVLTVDVAVWYRVDAVNPNAAQADLNVASDIYLDRRAGMVFSEAAVSIGGQKTWYESNPACPGVEIGLDFTVNPNMMNVVYVQEIDIDGDDRIRGLTCDRPGLAPVVIVSWMYMSPSTLPHEFAHVLGLWNPPLSGWRGGHTTYLDDFDETNLMWARDNGTAGVPRDHLSLGQVFRMNIDESSWVNRTVVVDGVPRPPIRTGDTEACQSDRDTRDPCPELSWDLGER